MASPQKAYVKILQDVLDEYGARIQIDGGSRVLVSDPDIAHAVYETTSGVRTPYGPQMTVASRTQGDSTGLPANTDAIVADKLKMDHYTHAVFAVSSEDPKYVLEGLKHMRYAMQPKGYAIVICLRQQTGQQAEDGSYVVDLVDKMKYQSRGKITKFTDVFEFAGFETGKIRSFGKTAEVEGKKVDAEVVLAAKWDQLTA